MAQAPSGTTSRLTASTSPPVGSREAAGLRHRSGRISSTPGPHLPSQPQGSRLTSWEEAHRRWLELERVARAEAATGGDGSSRNSSMGSEYISEAAYQPENDESSADDAPTAAASTEAVDWWQEAPTEARRRRALALLILANSATVLLSLRSAWDMLHSAWLHARLLWDEFTDPGGGGTGSQAVAGALFVCFTLRITWHLALWAGLFVSGGG